MPQRIQRCGPQSPACQFTQRGQALVALCHDPGRAGEAATEGRRTLYEELRGLQTAGDGVSMCCAFVQHVQALAHNGRGASRRWLQATVGPILSCKRRRLGEEGGEADACLATRVLTFQGECEHQLRWLRETVQRERVGFEQAVAESGDEAAELASAARLGDAEWDALCDVMIAWSLRGDLEVLLSDGKEWCLGNHTIAKGLDKDQALWEKVQRINNVARQQASESANHDSASEANDSDVAPAEVARCLEELFDLTENDGFCPVGFFKDLQCVAALVAAQPRKDAILAQRGTMSADDVNLVEHWLHLLQCADDVGKATSFADFAAKASPYWCSLRFLADRIPQVESVLQGHCALARAEHLVEHLHGLCIGLRVEQQQQQRYRERHRGEGSCTAHVYLEKRRSVGAEVEEERAFEGLTREHIRQCEQVLLDNGRHPCTRADAEGCYACWLREETPGHMNCAALSAARGAGEIDTRHVSCFLYQCELLHQLEELATRLVGGGAAEPASLVIDAQEGMLRVGDVNALRLKTEELRLQLQQWEAGLALARRRYPGLWCLSGTQLSAVRAACQEVHGRHHSGDDPAIAASTTLKHYLLAMLPLHTRARGAGEQEFAAWFAQCVETEQHKKGLPWVDRLGAVLEANMQSTHFCAELPAPLHETVATPLAFSALVTEEAITRCIAVEPTVPSAASESDMPLLLLGMYLGNFHRLPYAFELLVCDPATTKEELLAFVARWEGLTTTDCGQRCPVAEDPRDGWAACAEGSAAAAAAGEHAYPVLCFTIVGVELLDSDVLLALRDEVQACQARDKIREESRPVGHVHVADADTAAVAGGDEKDPASATAAASATTTTTRGSHCRLVTPTLVLLAGPGTSHMANGSAAAAVAGGGKPARWEVSEILRSFGAVGHVDENQLTATRHLLQKVMGSEDILGSRFTVATGHATLPSSGGGDDAIAWKYFTQAPQDPQQHGYQNRSTSNAGGHPPPPPLPKRYLRCAFDRLVDASADTDEAVLVRVDIDPYAHPAAVNRVILSLLTTGSLTNDADTGRPYIAKATDRFVFAVPDAARCSESTNAKVTMTTTTNTAPSAVKNLDIKARECTQTPCYGVLQDCLAFQLLPRETFALAIVTQRLHMTPATAPLSVSSPHVPLLLSQRARFDDNKAAQLAMQALLLAMGAQAGAIYHFPLPDTLGRSVSAAPFTLQYFGFKEEEERNSKTRRGPPSLHPCSHSLSPGHLFALLYRLLTQPETLPLTLATRPTTRQAGVLCTACPTTEWVPDAVSELAISQVYRLYHQLVPSIHAILLGSAYRGILDKLPKDKAAQEVEEKEEGEATSTLFTVADARLSKGRVDPVTASGSTSQVLELLHAVQQTILWEVNRCIAVVRNGREPTPTHCQRGRVSWQPILPPALRSCSLGSTRVVAASMLQEQRDDDWLRGRRRNSNRTADDDEHVRSYLCAAHGEEMVRIADVDLGQGEEVSSNSSSSNGVGGASGTTFEERYLCALIHDPTALLAHTAVQPGFGRELAVALALLKAQLSSWEEVGVEEHAGRSSADDNRGDDDPEDKEAVPDAGWWSIASLPRCQDLVTVYAICIHAVREHRPHCHAHTYAQQAKGPTTASSPPPTSCFRMWDELRECVELYLAHVTERAVPSASLRGVAATSASTRFTFHTQARRFTLTPYLVKLMAEVTTRWRAREAVVLSGGEDEGDRIGVGGSGMSEFAAYCAAMSGLPYRRLTCHGAMTPESFASSVQALVEEMRGSWEDGGELLTRSENSSSSSSSDEGEEEKGQPQPVNRQCVLVLDDIHRFRFPWVMKQTLVDHRFGVDVLFIATMSSHQADGVGRAAANTTVPLAPEVELLATPIPFAPLTSPLRAVSRHFLRVYAGDKVGDHLTEGPRATMQRGERGVSDVRAVVQDEELVLREAVEWMCTTTRWRTKDHHADGASLSQLLGYEVTPAVKQSLCDVVRRLMASIRDTATTTTKAESAAAEGNVGLCLLWRWMDAFIFYAGVAAHLLPSSGPPPAHSDGADNGNGNGNSGDLLQTAVYGATLLSSCLALPANQRAERCSTAILPFIRGGVTASPVQDHQRLLRMCTCFPPNIYASRGMEEMSLAMQFATFHERPVCTLVQGPPGAGKTTVLSSLEWRASVGGGLSQLGGPYAPFVRRSLSCTPDTRPEDIDRAAREAAEVCLVTSALTVLELDSVEHLVGSRFDAQTALRRIMDEGVYVPRTGQFHSIHIICLSSTPIGDDALMSRFTIVNCLRSSAADYCGVAKCLSRQLSPDGGVAHFRWEKFFAIFSPWLDRVNAEGDRCVTPRDVYAVVKTAHYLLGVADELARSGSSEGRAEGGEGKKGHHHHRLLPHALFIALCRELGISRDRDNGGHRWRDTLQAFVHAATTTTTTARGTAHNELDSVPATYVWTRSLRMERGNGGTTPTPSLKHEPIFLCEVCHALLTESGLCPASDTFSRVRGTAPDEPHCQLSLQEMASVIPLAFLGVHGRTLPPRRGGEVGLRLRHTMLVGPPDKAWQMLRQQLGHHLHATSRREPGVILGRGGANDGHVGGENRRDANWLADIRTVRQCVVNGHLLLLIDAPHAYHYVKDVLPDGSGSPVPDGAVAMLDSQGNREYVKVHDDFRVVALTSESNYKQLQVSVRSRFSTFFLPPPSVAVEGAMVTARNRHRLATFHRHVLSAVGAATTGNELPLLSYLTPPLGADYLSSFVASHNAALDAMECDEDVEVLLTRVLAAAVSPARFLALRKLSAATITTTTTHQEVVPSTDQELPVALSGQRVLRRLQRYALDSKDDLPTAFAAYTDTICGSGGGAGASAAATDMQRPRHALVFTGQQPRYDMNGSYADLLGVAWAETVQQCWHRARQVEQSPPLPGGREEGQVPHHWGIGAGMAAAKTYNLAHLCESDLLRRELRALASSIDEQRRTTSDVPYPIVFYLFEQPLAVAKGTDRRSSGSTTTNTSSSSVVWHLRRLFVLLSESGLEREPRLCVAVVVILCPATLFVPWEPAVTLAASAEEAYSAAAVPAAWAVLHVDEVFPCEWGALRQPYHHSTVKNLRDSHGAAEGAEPVATHEVSQSHITITPYEPPQFKLCDVEGGTLTPVRLLSENPDLLLRLVQSNLGRIAQELEELSGSEDAVSRWREGLRALFLSPASGDGNAGATLRGTLLRYTQEQLRQQVDFQGQRYHAEMRQLTGECGGAALLAVAACSRNSSGGAQAVHEFSSLRSVMLDQAQTVALNVSIATITLLFPTPRDMLHVCAAVAATTAADATIVADKQHCSLGWATELTHFLLMKCGPDGGLLPLDEFTDFSSTRHISLRDIWRRQSFFTRRPLPSSPNGQQQQQQRLPSRLSFSYLIYRLFEERAEAVDGQAAVGTAATTRDFTEPLSLVLTQAMKAPEDVDRYVHDAFLYFLEREGALASHSGFSDSVLWCLVMLLDVHLRPSTTEKEGVRHWGASVGSAAEFLSRQFHRDVKWILNAHRYCEVLETENGGYVSHLRCCYPSAVLAAQIDPPLYASVPEFYECMTFRKPIPASRAGAVEGDNSNAAPAPAPAPPPATPRLRASARELVLLSATTTGSNPSLQWCIDTQRLSYMLLPETPEEDDDEHADREPPCGEPGTSDMDAAAAAARTFREQRAAVVASLLREGCGSPLEMCLWLHHQLRGHGGGQQVKHWLCGEVVPMVVAHLCWHSPHEAGDARPLDALPKDGVVASKLLGALVGDDSGAIYCPSRTMLTLLDAAFRRWMSAFAPDGSPTLSGSGGGTTTIATATATDFPLAVLAAPLSKETGGELARLVVVALTTVLDAHLPKSHGSTTTATAGGYFQRKDVVTRERLWHLLLATWKTPPQQCRDGVCFRSLTVLLAISVLQVEMESTRSLLLQPDLPCSDTPQHRERQEVMCHLGRKLYEFHCVAGTALLGVGSGGDRHREEVEETSVDATQVRLAIYVLLLRVLSSGGLDLPTTRQYFSAIVSAAPTRPDFSSNALLSELMLDSQKHSVLDVILNDQFILGDHSSGDGRRGEAARMSDGVRVSLLQSVAWLAPLISEFPTGVVTAGATGGDKAAAPLTRSTAADPQISLKDPACRAVCEGFQTWLERMAALRSSPLSAPLVAGVWTNEEAQHTLAALALYLSVNFGDGSQNGLGYFAKVLEGRESVTLALHEAAGPPRNNTLSQQELRGRAVARAAKAAAAFLSSVVQQARPFFQTQREKFILSELIGCLTPNCPRCHTCFVDFTGCCALECGNASCGSYFCAWCLAVSGDSASVHSHVSQCPSSPTKGALHARAEIWFAAYLAGVFPRRLEALLGRRQTPCNMNGVEHAFFRPLTAEEQLLLARMGPAELEYLRYLAYAAVPTLGVSSSIPYDLVQRELTRAAREDLLRPVRLTGYEVAKEALDDALRQVRLVLFPGGSGRLAPSVPLKFLLALLVSCRANRATTAAPSAAVFQERVARVNATALVSQLDAAASATVEHAGRPSLLSDLAAWGPCYDRAVHKAIANGQPGAMLPYLFRSLLHGRDAAEGDAAASTAAEAKEGSVGLRRLLRYQTSYTAAAANRLQAVLDFALDARRVVRRHFVSKQAVCDASLVFLTRRYGSLFPRERVAGFIRTCQEMLDVLNRADNRCHAGQVFTIAESTDPEKVSLAEAVGMDAGTVLNVLFTGSDAVGDAEPEHVGYGNAQHGQSRVLEGLHLDMAGVREVSRDYALAMAEQQRAMATDDRAFLLHASTDLLQYDSALLPLLLGLFGEAPLTTPGLPAAQAAGHGIPPLPGKGDANMAAISRVVSCSAGCLARPMLPVALPELELDTSGIADLLAGVEGWLADTLAPAFSAGTSEEATAATTAEAGEGERAARYSRAVQCLDGMAHTHHATTGTNFRDNVFSFLVTYSRFAQAALSAYDFTEDMVATLRRGQRRAAAAATLPAFSQVPQPQLTDRQRSAQAALTEAHTPPTDAPLLLLAAFTPAEWDRTALEEKTPPSSSALPFATQDWTAERERAAVAEAVRSLRNGGGPTYQGPLIAALKLVLLHASILGLDTHGKQLADIIPRVCVDYELAQGLVDWVGLDVHFSSLPDMIGMMENT